MTDPLDAFLHANRPEAPPGLADRLLAAGIGDGSLVQHYYWSEVGEVARTFFLASLAGVVLAGVALFAVLTRAPEPEPAPELPAVEAPSQRDADPTAPEVQDDEDKTETETDEQVEPQDLEPLDLTNLAMASPTVDEQVGYWLEER